MYDIKNKDFFDYTQGKTFYPPKFIQEVNNMNPDYFILGGISFLVGVILLLSIKLFTKN